MASSELRGLEVDEKGRPAAPTGWGATYEVKIPKQHMEARRMDTNKTDKTLKKQ